MATVRNPILPGFNPDPSICRVGSDFFVATSTFEWYPGVQIHQSTNLVDWYLINRPLERSAQLDMRGNPDSCGVWAPSLSYSDGLFWLVYTDVKRFDGNFKDAHNYIVTAPAITGPWSDPVYVNSSGFDPSLFHDTDGRKWFINMVWNHRADRLGTHPSNSFFGGILLQEYDVTSQQLIGDVQSIYDGTDHGGVEAPHLFLHEGRYYLTVAEGGTGYLHAVTLARSDSITGPYITHPHRHVITAKDHPDAELQRAGHGQYVIGPDGNPWFTHLCSRPLPDTRVSPRGRETGIQKCRWDNDGWLYVQHDADGYNPCPQTDIEVDLSGHDESLSSIDQSTLYRPGTDRSCDFTGNRLPPEFQWLRTPDRHRLLSLDDNPRALRLFGRESIGSWFEQSLIARRQEHSAYRSETSVDFNPTTYQHGAGLIAYYSRHKFHALCITWDETLGRCLTIMSCNGDYPECRVTYPLAPNVSLPLKISEKAGEQHTPVELAIDVNQTQLQFSVRTDSNSPAWESIGPVLDAGVISDEGGRGEHASFTGAFVGMFAFDITGRATPADFFRFSYSQT